MCQPLCRFGPWEDTAVRRGPITVPGILIALYGTVFVIYVSRDTYVNFLAALAGCVGPGPVPHEDYAGGILSSALVLYLACFRIQCC
jgi:hypothetical protein